MKAVILAAGIGSRLRPITNNKPKTLVNVNNKPILSYIIDALIKNNITNIIICVGFKAEMVINYCQLSYPFVNFTFVENKDFEITNNMYSFYLAQKYLKDDFLLINGDVVFQPEIISLIKNSQKSSVAVTKGKYFEESMKIKIDLNGEIIKISKRIPKNESYAVSIDVYKIVKKDILAIKDELKRIIEFKKEKNQWTEVMLDNLFSSKKIIAYPIDIADYKWVEIDNFDDLNQAEIIFNQSINQLKNKKVFFFDVDGTLTIENKIIKESIKFIDYLLAKKKLVYIITNNSSKTPDDHLKNLLKAGLKIDKKNMLVSTQSALSYFKNKGIKKIFWLANEKVSNYIKKEGFIFSKKNPQALLLTFDTEITYRKLITFIELIRKGLPYYATHHDILCPSKSGFIPDIGTFIELIRLTTNKNPDLFFGKPNKEFINNILNKHHLSYKDAVIIGDRLYTDILLGKNSGCLTILTLTGETKREDYEKSEIKADIVVKNLNQILEYL